MGLPERSGALISGVEAGGERTLLDPSEAYNQGQNTQMGGSGTSGGTMPLEVSDAESHRKDGLFCIWTYVWRSMYLSVFTCIYTHTILYM